ncbi:hypothetical protein L4C36_23505 [Photobacterium japonica]|uniref:hypothetical protein n=1 Tax=Photobacterium japonica TaxID=2910235 RepID=UPI003D0F74E4
MSFHINGVEPDIAGKQCQEFYLIQQQEGENITDPANVAYFKFENRWLKLHFDGESIFWRTGELPSEPVNSCLSTCLVLLNLNEFEGVVGSTLKEVTYDSNNEVVFANFEFTSGKVLKFQHYGHDDYTSINC